MPSSSNNTSSTDTAVVAVLLQPQSEQQQQQSNIIGTDHHSSSASSFDHNNNPGRNNNRTNNDNNGKDDETTRSLLQLQSEGLNGNDMDAQPPASSVDECLGLFKACCKKKADFGLEDMFWIMFLLIIIIFSILKGLTRYTWSQIMYMMFGSIALLILLYIGATIFNKFVLEDSSTAHWNAHARYTQAAIHCRLNEEEQRVHVIAPPKMGGAKLNIIYSIGDVPLVKTASSGSSSTINGAAGPNSRHGSIGSGVGMPNALSNLTQQAINTAAALLGNVQPPPITQTTTPTSAIQTTTTTTTITSNIHSTSSTTTMSTTTTTIKTAKLVSSSSGGGHGVNVTTGSTGTTGTSLIIPSSLKDEVIAEEEDRCETPSVHSINMN